MWVTSNWKGQLRASPSHRHGSHALPRHHIARGRIETGLNKLATTRRALVHRGGARRCIRQGLVARRQAARRRLPGAAGRVGGVAGAGPVFRLAHGRDRASK